MHLLKYFKKLSLQPENADTLRGLILDLAIRGRLTEDWRAANPDVEPATELLERIQAEKAQLIKEKKIKKEKPLPAITKEEKPFELPEGWVWCRLGTIIKVSSGKNLTSKNMVHDGGIPVYGGNGINGYHNEYNVSEPTIVIGRVGYYCGSIHITEEKAWITDNAFIVFYSKENIDQEYLSLLLQGTNLKENENATAQPVISGKKIYPIVLALPPLPEQKAIVQIVDRLMDEVAALEAQARQRQQLREQYVQSALRELTSGDSQAAWRALAPQFSRFFTTRESVEALKASILQLAVQGKLTARWRAAHPEVEPAAVLLEKIQAEKARLIKEKQIRKEKPLPAISEEEVPFELPEGWVWCRLLEICRLITDGAHHTPKYIEKGIPFLSVKNLSSGYLDFDNTRFISKEEHLKLIGRCHPERGDILLTKVGTTGIAVSIDTDLDFSIFVSVALLKVNNEFVDPKFLEYFLNSPLVKKQSQEGTEGVGNKNLVLRKIKSFTFLFPPLPEQQAIVAIVNQLMDFCDALLAQIERRALQSADFLRSAVREVAEEG